MPKKKATSPAKEEFKEPILPDDVIPRPDLHQKHNYALKQVKGTKKSKEFYVQSLMDEAGYCPMEALIEIAQNEDIPLETRMQCHKELAKYKAPQLKAVDVKANVKSDLNIEIVRFSNTPLLDSDDD